MSEVWIFLMKYSLPKYDIDLNRNLENISYQLK